MSKELKSISIPVEPIEYKQVVLQHSVPSRRGATTFSFTDGEPRNASSGFRITKDALGWVHVEDSLGDVEYLEIPPANVKELRRKKAVEVKSP